MCVWAIWNNYVVSVQYLYQSYCNWHDITMQRRWSLYIIRCDVIFTLWQCMVAIHIKHGSYWSWQHSSVVATDCWSMTRLFLVFFLWHARLTTNIRSTILAQNGILCKSATVFGYENFNSSVCIEQVFEVVSTSTTCIHNFTYYDDDLDNFLSITVQLCIYVTVGTCTDSYQQY